MPFDKTLVFKLFTISCLLHSCQNYQQEQQALSLAEAKEERVQLEEELTEAKHALALAQQRVDYLSFRYSRTELVLIQERIHLFERELPKIQSDPLRQRRFKKEQLPGLFAEERETLTRMIDQHHALEEEAEKALNKILSLITQLNRHS